MLTDLVRLLRESTPRLAAAIESSTDGSGSGAAADEALLGRLLVLHEAMGELIRAHERAVTADDPFPTRRTEERAASEPAAAYPYEHEPSPVEPLEGPEGRAAVDERAPPPPAAAPARPPVNLLD